MHTLVKIGLVALVMNAGAALAEPAVISPQEYKDALQSMDYGKHQLDARQFEQRMQEKGTVILDLRSEPEYAQSHIRGAKHLGPDIDEEALQRLVPSKNSTILIYCRNSISDTPTRMLSLTASSLPQFIVLGYRNTYYLDDLYKQPENGLVVQRMLTRED